jgi:hypothetical protein
MGPFSPIPFFCELWRRKERHAQVACFPFFTTFVSNQRFERLKGRMNDRNATVFIDEQEREVFFLEKVVNALCNQSMDKASKNAPRCFLSTRSLM